VSLSTPVVVVGAGDVEGSLQRPHEVRGAVPVDLKGHGRVLTFSAPLALVSDHSDDGRFDYLLAVFRYGATTHEVQATSTVG
jgi:hypothetical protein